MSDHIRETIRQRLVGITPRPPDNGAADLWLAARDLHRAGIGEAASYTVLYQAMIEWGEGFAKVYDQEHLLRIINRARLASDDGEGALIVVTAVNLAEAFTAYRPALIDGLLREGETMNVIAAPKVGKSWLVLLMAFNLANGKPFLGRDCQRGTVLIIDNELHPETAAQRLRAVGDGLGLPLDGIHLVSLRGHLEGLPVLAGRLVKAAKSVGAKVIILDALYRLLPEGVSENDNAGMASVYNTIDRIAAETGAAVVCIHHSSKGSQGEKSVTDGGSGAGSISRAADTHLFLREHDEPEHVVIDAVARSWPRPESIVIRRAGSLWIEAPDADPALVKGRKLVTASTHVPYSRVVELIPPTATPFKAIAAEARTSLNLSSARTQQMLDQAVQQGLLHRSVGDRNAVCYSTRPAPQDGNADDRVTAYITAHPDATARQVATACSVSDKTVRRSPAWGSRPLDIPPGQPMGQPQGQPMMGGGQPTSSPLIRGVRLTMSTPPDVQGGRDPEDKFAELPTAVVGQ